MSLELAILEHAASIRLLAAALQNQGTTGNATTAAATQTDEKPAQKLAGESLFAETAPPATKAPVAQPSYAETAKVIVDLRKEKGRDVAVKVLSHFQAATLQDVKPADYAAIIALAEKELAK